jgi:tRNA threonylcarbamoyladenosine biosynthesis protein TsaB
MIRLSIDTTAAQCAVGLSRRGGDPVVIAEEIGRGHAEKLAPMAQAVLAQAGIAAEALDEIRVAVGPGGFAGARVGIAFARGLALASGAPARGVNTLDAFAVQAGDQTRLACLHGAKRGEILWRGWRAGEALGPMARLTVEDAADAVRAALGEGEIALAGSGAALIEGAGFADTGVRTIDVARLADMPEALLGPASPVYARPPDAKLPGGVSV